MSSLQTPTARAIIYFCCIGGLLVLNSLIVIVLWNEVFHDLIDTDRRLTFLEGAGLTAFAYVGVFSMRYALHARRDTTNERDAPPIQPSDHDTGREGLRTMCSHLTPDEKAKLKQELVTNCGCADRSAAAKSTGTQHAHHTV